ncbi:hypothetical protein [Pararobbsia silviterrae]|uniref:Uncharacterized protein n=1 Tax=Pararobbsia silviterrae TaxID=1792498 RepID=A0A494X1T3_9BURK|nr:hypothetical protein [Pararobbsia silviterrae]RKP44685.1 hypothetical protein D7S86_27020 [Pararobbsia silviterrae]
MTTSFDTSLTGFRFVRSHFGDTLRDVALRELGDASKWRDLVAINSLQPPYLTDDSTLASDTVLLNGRDYITIPASAAAAATTEAEDVFGTDCLLNADGTLGVTASGDFATVSGVANLQQALTNAVGVEKKELIYHPDYGCIVRQLLGAVAGPAAELLAADDVKTTVEADPRINSVTSSTGSISGDSITVSTVAQAINGQTVTTTAAA